MNSAAASTILPERVQLFTKDTVVNPVSTEPRDTDTALDEILNRVGASPEQKLASNVLLLAMDDASQNPYGVPLRQRTTNSKERIVELVAEAQWFLLDDREHVEFSFYWCCEVLNFNPRRARKAVKAILKKKRVLMPANDRYYYAMISGMRRNGTYLKRRKDNEVYV